MPNSIKKVLFLILMGSLLVACGKDGGKGGGKGSGGITPASKSSFSLSESTLILSAGVGKGCLGDLGSPPQKIITLRYNGSAPLLPMSDGNVTISENSNAANGGCGNKVSGDYKHCQSLVVDYTPTSASLAKTKEVANFFNNELTVTAYVPGRLFYNRSQYAFVPEKASIELSTVTSNKDCQYNKNNVNDISFYFNDDNSEVSSDSSNLVWSDSGESVVQIDLNLGGMKTFGEAEGMTANYQSTPKDSNKPSSVKKTLIGGSSAFTYNVTRAFFIMTDKNIYKLNPRASSKKKGDIISCAASSDNKGDADCTTFSDNSSGILNSAGKNGAYNLSQFIINRPANKGISLIDAKSIAVLKNKELNSIVVNINNGSGLPINFPNKTSVAVDFDQNITLLTATADKSNSKIIYQAFINKEGRWSGQPTDLVDSSAKCSASPLSSKIVSVLSPDQTDSIIYLLREMDQSGKTGGSLVCVFKLTSDKLVYQGSMSVFKDSKTSKNIDEATMTFVQVPDSSGGSSPQVFTIGSNGQSYEGSLLPQGDYFPGLYSNDFLMNSIPNFTVSAPLLLSASIGGNKPGERVYYAVTYAVTADPPSSSSSDKSAQYTVSKYDEKNKTTQNVLLPVAKGSSIIALAIDADTGSVLTYEGVFHNDPPKGGSTKIDIKSINKTIKLYRIDDSNPSKLNYLTPITINPVEGEDPVNVYNG